MIARSATLQFVLGLIGLVLVWEAVGRAGWLGSALPPLSETVATLFAPANSRLFATAASSTALSSLWGLLIGVGAAFVLSVAALAFPPLRPGFDRFAGFVHALPLIGIAPVLIVVMGRESAPAAVATLGAFFSAYVAIGASFRRTSSVHSDLFTTLGSSTLSRFVRLQLPSSLPGLIDALRLAAPGAVLGAVLGEWFGAPQGVGIVILSSAQNYQIPQLWAAALLATVMALGAYGALSGVQSIVRWRLS